MPEELEQQAQPEETTEQKYARLYAQQAAQPVVATLPPEVVETITALRSEISSLKDAVTPRPAPAANNYEWVEKIRNGDFEGAQKAMAAEVQKALQPALEETRNKAYQDALSATTVNLEIDRHVQKLRLENPELVQFDRYLQAPVAQRVEEAKAAGKIKTPSDFIKEYKAAIDAEVSELRNLGLVLRGQGKQEANTRNQQVLASTPLVPNQVLANQVSQESQQPSGESTDDYFARRRADENRRRGLQ